MAEKEEEKGFVVKDRRRFTEGAEAEEKKQTQPEAASAAEEQKSARPEEASSKEEQAQGPFPGSYVGHLHFLPQFVGPGAPGRNSGTSNEPHRG